MTHHPAVGYLLLPAPGDGEPPSDLARCCDLLGEHAPIVEPDSPHGAWCAVREGKRAPAPARTGQAILALLDWHGFPDSRLAFAPTPGVARLVARVATAPLTIVTAEDVPGFLAPLAVEVLGLNEEATDQLHRIGLHTLATIAALPRGALGDYLGTLGVALEALARGEDDRPLLPGRPPRVLRARRDLDWPLTDRAALAALVQRLIAPLLAHLAREGLGVTRATLTLHFRARRVRVAARLGSPTSGATTVVGALLVEVDCALDQPRPDDPGDPDAAADTEITALAVTLIAPRPLPVRQMSFFDVPQGRLARLHEGIAEAQRRGEGIVGYLRPLEVTHPRREWRYTLDQTTRSPEAAR